MSAMFFFKRIIVVFWALWWMLAFLTRLSGRPLFIECLHRALGASFKLSGAGGFADAV